MINITIFVIVLTRETIFIVQSELYKWLPSVSCIFYAGGKDYRTKLFHQVSVHQVIHIKC